MKLEFDSRICKLYGLTPLLGTQPPSLAIRQEYLQKRALKNLKGIALADKQAQLDLENEIFSLDEEGSGLNIFARDSARNDCICLMGHHIKGFFKETLLAIKAQANIAMPQGKVDTLLFVEPRFIPITRDGKEIYEEDDILERPLIADTPKGKRTALQSSEQLYDPWEVQFEITLMPNKATAKSDALTWEHVDLALQYGAFHGLGQWRNAAYGKFRYELLEADE